MKRGDDGVTLVELLICIALMGVIASALTTSFVASTRSIDQSGHRMANTHDSQMAASLFSSDMQSANWVWTATALFPFSTCGGPGQSLVTFAWPGSDASGQQETRVATYRVIDQDGEHQLVRQLCTGPGLAVPDTPTSTVVIAHNLSGTTPTVDCFDSGNAKLRSCDGSAVFVAQLTAHAQAKDSDVTGFDYVLRATRRPTPPPFTRGPSTPAFVRATSGREANSGATTTTASFTEDITAGNLIVAYVVWNNRDPVDVRDGLGNPFTPLPGGSVPWTTGASAQVFYANNVAGGTNAVTARFATAVGDFGLLYIMEYSGIEKTANPVGGASSRTGTTGPTMDSGPVTANANDLLVGVGAAHNGTVTATDAAFFPRLIGDGWPGYGNIVEDHIAVAAGDYRATATSNTPNVKPWVMQLVAFRADPGGAPPP